MSKEVAEGRSITITLPLPGPELRGNKRGHTQYVPPSKKSLQEEAYFKLQDEIEQLSWDDFSPWFKRAVVRYDYYYFGTSPDPDNVITGMKAALDVATSHTKKCDPYCRSHVDLLPNDGPRCIKSLTIVSHKAESKDNVRVAMAITEVLE